MYSRIYYGDFSYTTVSDAVELALDAAAVPLYKASAQFGTARTLTYSSAKGC